MESGHKQMQSINVIDIEKRRVPSKHYVFVLEITWADGSQNIIYRRYSQFFVLQTSLIDAFPVEGGVKNPAERILPFLPGKVLFRSQVREVALKRKSALEEYCKKLIKLPAHILNCEYVTSFFEATAEDIGSLTNSLTGEDRKKKKSQKRADIISEPVLLEQYLALADFKKVGRGQISVVAGDVVDVIEKSDNGWYFVSLDDEQGWVPCSYLEPMSGDEQEVTVETCTTEEKFVCVKPYKAAFDDEIDLELGSIVIVLQKGSDGWWLVRYRGKEGWAPRAYLKSSSHLSLPTTAANVDVVKDKGAIQAKGKLGVAPPPRRRTVKRTISAEVKRASIKRSQRNSSDECKYVALSDYQMKIGKKEVNISQGKSFEIIEKAPNGWSLVKIGDEEGWVPSDILTKQRKGAIALFEEGEDIYQNVKNVIIEEINEQEDNNNIIIEKYLTIGAFTSNDESGISFHEGVEAEVLEKNKTGWWFIKIGTDEGWAPSTYLSPSTPKKLISNSASESGEKLEIAVPPRKPNRKSEIPQSYENVDGSDDIKPPPKPKTPSPVNHAIKQQLRISPKPDISPRPVSPNPKPRTRPQQSAQINELKKAIAKGVGSPTPQPRKMRTSMSLDESHLQPDRKTPPPKPSMPPIRGRKISEPARPFQKSQANVTNKRKTSEIHVTANMRVSPGIPERPKLESLNLYETLSRYVDNDEGMLSFEAGEKVEVLEKDEGGWWLARIGLKKGWVPSNFLKKL